MAVKVRNPDGTLRNAARIEPEKVMLDESDVAFLRPLIQSRVDQEFTQHGDLAGYQGFTPRIKFDEGRWLLAKETADGSLGEVDLTDWANKLLVRDYVARKRKALRLAEFKSTILAVRPAMTDDEFLAWCADVIPLLIA